MKIKGPIFTHCYSTQVSLHRSRSSARPPASCYCLFYSDAGAVLIVGYQQLQQHRISRLNRDHYRRKSLSTATRPRRRLLCVYNSIFHQRMGGHVSSRLGRSFPFQSIKERRERENNRMKRPPDRAAVKNKKETTGRHQQKIEDERDVKKKR